MKNSFIILISLFSISSLFVSAQTQECQIGYYDVPQPPMCTTETDEDGQPEEVCTAVGSAAFAGITNPTEPSFSESTFPLNDIDWSGTCNCTLLAYSGENLTGYWLAYPFNETTENKVVVTDLLTTAPKSFNITCIF